MRVCSPVMVGEGIMAVMVGLHGRARLVGLACILHGIIAVEYCMHVLTWMKSHRKSERKGRKGL